MYKELFVQEMLEAGKDTFLVTEISSSFSEEGERTINECFREEMEKADRVEISVAYCSCNSLQEIDTLVEKKNIKVCLILGVYFLLDSANHYMK